MNPKGVVSNLGSPKLVSFWHPSNSPTERETHLKRENPLSHWRRTIPASGDKERRSDGVLGRTWHRRPKEFKIQAFHILRAQRVLSTPYLRFLGLVQGDLAIVDSSNPQIAYRSFVQQTEDWFENTNSFNTRQETITDTRNHEKRQPTRKKQEIRYHQKPEDCNSYDSNRTALHKLSIMQGANSGEADTPRLDPIATLGLEESWHPTSW